MAGKYNVKCTSCKTFIPVADARFLSSGGYRCKEFKKCAERIKERRQTQR